MHNIYGKPKIELEHLIDLDSFDRLHLDICRGIAEAKSKAMDGYLVRNPIYDPADVSYTTPINPLMTAYQHFLSLPDENYIKQTGIQIEKNYGAKSLAVYIKYVYKAHDLGSHYSLWDFTPGWRTTDNSRLVKPMATHFESLICWIDQLIDRSIFYKIGRAYVVTHDSFSITHEHADPILDPDASSEDIPEFIHIRPDLSRPFYVYDPEQKKKHYVETRVGWWNDKDLHGGDQCPEPTYAIRIDGLFTEEFKKNFK